MKLKAHQSQTLAFDSSSNKAVTRINLNLATESGLVSALPKMEKELHKALRPGGPFQLRTILQFWPGAMNCICQSLNPLGHIEIVEVLAA